MLRQLLTLAVVLAATAAGIPLDDIPSTTSSAPTSTPTPVRPTHSCTLISGENPYVIANYTRPACACDCLSRVCRYLTDGSREQIIQCATLPWPGSTNPWSSGLISGMGTCTGSQRCIG